MPLFLILLCQNIPDLVSQLGAVELEVRADAEARLVAADPVHVGELRGLRAASRDVEVRARLDAVVRRVLRRHAQRLYEEGNLPEALRVLAEIEPGEGQDPSAAARVEWAERRLKDLLRERSPGFSADGDVLMPTSWERLAPQLEPHLPWIYPALIRGLEPGSADHGNASFILLKLGDRAVPALCWALRTSTPAVRSRACSLLREMRAAGPLAVASLEAAGRSSDAELRRQSRMALERLSGSR
jgi:hypothetical protein